MNTLLKSDRTKKVIKVVAIVAMVALFGYLCMNGMAFAEYTETIKGVLEKMISVVGTVFQAVGVILSVYSVGQLVLAFKNEDADSKSRASTMLVVGVVLIAMPAVIEGVGLLDMFGA